MKRYGYNGIPIECESFGKSKRFLRLDCHSSEARVGKAADCTNGRKLKEKTVYLWILECDRGNHNEF